MRRPAMFEKKNSLPGPEPHSPARDRNHLARPRQDHADVRRHIVGAFRVVLEIIRALRHQAIEECLEIAARGRISVLHDNQTATGVLRENRRRPELDPARGHDPRDFIGDLHRPFALRPNFEFLAVSRHDEELLPAWRLRSNGLIFRVRSLFLIFGAMLLLGVAQMPGATAEQKEIAELYRRGLAGDKAAVVQCIAKLEDVLQAQPGNQLARVYLGSAYTLRSRDLGIGLNKLRTLRRGLAIMDEAVAASPNESKVRLVRALTDAELPGFFGRAESSRKDFVRLAATAEAAPEKFEEGDLQIIFFRAGLAAKAQGDRTRAGDLLHKAQAHPADAALAEKIRAELATL